MTRDRRLFFWGNIVQFTGLVLLGAGVTCEFIMGGDIYLIGITLGAIIFSIGTKVKGS